MASLAEMMFQSAAQNIRDTKSDPSAIAKRFPDRDWETSFQQDLP